jgi:hypothetical protein
MDSRAEFVIGVLTDLVVTYAAAEPRDPAR